MVDTLFICSARHSGSTLLDLLLGAHSRIASLGEISHLPKNIALDTECACGAKVSVCALWNPVLDRLSAEIGADLRADPYRLQTFFPIASHVIDHARQTPRYKLWRQWHLGLAYLRWRTGLRALEPLLGTVHRAAADTALIYDAVRAVAPADVVVDSSKSYLNALVMYRARPEATRIIFLTRDGRGVLHSDVKRGVARADSVRDWHAHYARALSLLHKNVPPEHLLPLRFEALTADPAAELSRLLTAAGLQFEPAMLDYHSKVHHVANGNDIRLLGHNPIRREAGWKSALSADDLAYFERTAGALNRQLGHS